MLAKPLTFLLLILISVSVAGCQNVMEKSGQEIAAPALGAQVGARRAQSGPRLYDITESLEVVNRGPGQPSKQNIWVALISDVEPYQKVLSTTISPAGYTIITDEYGNRYAEFNLDDMPPGASVPIEIRYQVRVEDIEYDLGDCSGDLPDFFTQPDLHVESKNPQIVALAEELSADKANACEKVRAFYDYVGDNLIYTYNGADWGAQAALGEMGADCTEYASLMMALTRAAGIPARYLEGLNYINDETTALARQEHAWLEVYLPGAGWTAMDPTLGRTGLTRDSYFARATPNHIIVTRGRNPSVLRGGSYFTHLYWPGNSTDIRIENFGWDIRVE